MGISSTKNNEWYLEKILPLFHRRDYKRAENEIEEIRNSCCRYR